MYDGFRFSSFALHVIKPHADGVQMRVVLHR